MPYSISYIPALLLVCLCALLGSGCATRQAGSERQFQFHQDTFAYANQLVWEYSFDSEDRMTVKKRQPPPEYALHCFPMARAAKLFFEHAEFRPDLPALNEGAYRPLVRQVMRRNVRATSDRPPVVIPGYADLRSFSLDYPELLKDTCGSAWQSYVQRGNWRMVLPFSRTHQARQSKRLAAALEKEEPLIVHLVRFPQLTINHAVTIYEAVPTEYGWEFTAYDPNLPETPVPLVYDKHLKTFYWPRSHYFSGGRVDVYRVYHKVCY